VCSNAACFACGPYVVPSARVDAYVAYTNNPPCGAMRGFGAVQTAFAHESQMDKLAAALGLDPVELTGNEEASIDLAVVQMLVRRMAGPPGKNQADSEAGSQDEGEERDERGGPEASEA